MPNAKFPFILATQGKLRRETIQEISNISLGTGEISGDRIQVPQYGDLIALEVQVTTKADGTLADPATVEKALKEIVVTDKRGKSLMKNIRGEDLAMLCRMSNVGRSRTIPTTSNSSQTHAFLLPFIVDRQGSMPIYSTVKLAPYTSLDSAATGGNVSVKLVGWFADDTNSGVTQKFSRLTKTLNSGTNRYKPDLPEESTIQSIYFKVGSESNISSIDFSGNGQTELSSLTPSDLQLIDDEVLVDGHVTGEFSLYNSAFVVGSKTVFTVEGEGSDTMEIFLVEAQNVSKED